MNKVDVSSARTGTFQDKGLKCMYTNLDSFNNKRSELEVRIAQTKPDIIGLTEIKPKHATWELTAQELTLYGYTTYVNLEGRGMALHVKDSIRSSEVNSGTCSDGSLWCELKLKDRDKLIVGVVYRSPSSTEEQNKKLEIKIAEVVSSKPTHLLIMGDFNYPSIDWDSQTSEGTLEERRFLDGFRDWYLFQHVAQPTHYRAMQTANILDLIFTSEEGMIDEIQYNEPIGKSHHLTLEWTLKCYVVPTVTKILKFSYEKGNYSGMREILGAENWDELLTDRTVDEQWSIISEKITCAVNTFVPHKLVSNERLKHKRPTWMDDRLLSRIKKKKSAFDRYRQTREGQDYLEYARARNSAKAEARRAIRDYEREIAKRAKQNPKAFYKYANSKMKTRTKITDLKTKDGSEVTTDKGKAEEFNRFFSSVFIDEDLNSIPRFTPSPANNQLLNFEVRDAEVYDLLKKIRVDKSPGPDNLHPRILHECATELTGPLSRLFRNSLESGALPTEWKTAHITPIFKKGRRSDASNYRPISLTSVCCKTMEKLVRNELLRHMISNRFLSEKQHGFVHGRSCTTQLLKVVDKWTEILDEGGEVDTVFLDFAKAFDTVPHQRCLAKLQGYGMGGKVLEWIRQFLTGRRQRVTVSGSFSTWADVVSGVPQGSVLGPVLFVCYINDLPETITSFLYMYADDTKVFRKVNCDSDREALQRDLNQLDEWAKSWQLSFNVEKCKVMHFGGQNSMNYEYTMTTADGRTSTLLETKEEKDLGVWVDNSLKPANHVAHAVKKANQILGLIRRTFTYMDSKLMKQLFTALVRPHLEYGNVVWHPYLKKDIELIEGVQHRATRMVPGLAKLAYEERLRIMNLPSLVYRRIRGDGIEVYKYVHGIYQVDSEEILPRNKTTGVSTRGHSLKLQKRGSKGQLRANFFGIRTVNLWNSMPENVVTAPTTNSFKNRIDRHYADTRFSTDTVRMQWSHCDRDRQDRSTGSLPTTD